MILVSFKENERDGTLYFKLSGHAGYSNPGTDIVCSAASILAHTLAQEVACMYESEKLSSIPTIKLDSGNAEIECKPKVVFLEKALSAFRLISTGFHLLADSYPQNVKIK